jgi:hypothetical protein
VRATPTAQNHHNWAGNERRAAAATCTAEHGRSWYGTIIIDDDDKKELRHIIARQTFHFLHGIYYQQF